MRWRRRRSAELEQAQVAGEQLLGLALAAQAAGELERTERRHAGELERLAATHAGELERLAATHRAELERAEQRHAGELEARELEAIERGLAQGRELERESVREANRLRAARKRASRDTAGPVTPDSVKQRDPDPAPSSGPDASRDTAGPVTPGPGTDATGDVVPSRPRLAEVPPEPNARAAPAVLRSPEPATDGALALAPQAELEPPPPASRDAAGPAPSRASGRARGPVLKNPPLTIGQNRSSEARGFDARGAELLAGFDRETEELETVAPDSVGAARQLLEAIAQHRNTNRGTVTQLLGFVRDGAPPFAFRDALSALEAKRGAGQLVPNPPAYVCGVIRHDHAPGFPGRLAATTTTEPASAELEAADALEARRACQQLRERLRRSAVLT